MSVSEKLRLSAFARDDATPQTTQRKPLGDLIRESLQWGRVSEEDEEDDGIDEVDPEMTPLPSIATKAPAAASKSGIQSRYKSSVTIFQEGTILDMNGNIRERPTHQAVANAYGDSDISDIDLDADDEASVSLARNPGPSVTHINYHGPSTPAPFSSTTQRFQQIKSAVGASNEPAPFSVHAVLDEVKSKVSALESKVNAQAHVVAVDPQSLEELVTPLKAEIHALGERVDKIHASTIPDATTASEGNSLRGEGNFQLGHTRTRYTTLGGQLSSVDSCLRLEPQLVPRLELANGMVHKLYLHLVCKRDLPATQGSVDGDGDIQPVPQPTDAPIQSKAAMTASRKRATKSSLLAQAAYQPNQDIQSVEVQALVHGSQLFVETVTGQVHVVDARTVRSTDGSWDITLALEPASSEPPFDFRPVVQVQRNAGGVINSPQYSYWWSAQIRCVSHQLV